MAANGLAPGTAVINNVEAAGSAPQSTPLRHQVMTPALSEKQKQASSSGVAGPNASTKTKKALVDNISYGEELAIEFSRAYYLGTVTEASEIASFTTEDLSDTLITTTGLSDISFTTEDLSDISSFTNEDLPGHEITASSVRRRMTNMTFDNKGVEHSTQIATLTDFSVLITSISLITSILRPGGCKLEKAPAFRYF